MLRNVLIPLFLSVACATSTESTVGDATPDELAAANILHGMARAEFESHVKRGGAFVLVGACDTNFPVSAVVFRNADGRSDTTALNHAKVALVPVAPGDYTVTGAEFSGRPAAAFQPAAFSSVRAATITFIGGISSDGQSEAVACPSIPRRAARSFPYQIARLPFHYGDALKQRESH